MKIAALFLLLLLALPAYSQDTPSFNDIDAADELQDISSLLANEEVDAGALNEVWSAMTDIDQIKRWLAIDGEFNPQIGGQFDLKLRDSYSVCGRIDIYMPPRRMRIIVIPDIQEGPLPTGPITIEMVVRETEKGTRLVVTVAGIPGSEDWEEYYRLSVDRWSTGLAELKSTVLGG